MTPHEQIVSLERLAFSLHAFEVVRIALVYAIDQCIHPIEINRR